MANQLLAETKRGRQALIEERDKRLEAHERWCESVKDQLAEYDRVIADLALNKLLDFVDRILERTAENELRYSHEEVVETAKYIKKETDLPCTT
jgi:hypothetical protein